MAPDPPPDLLASAQSQASVFRLLTWKATIPLEIQIARDSLPGAAKDESNDQTEHEELKEGEQEADLPRYYVSLSGSCAAQSTVMLTIGTCAADASTEVHLSAPPTSRNRAGISPHRDTIRRVGRLVFPTRNAGQGLSDGGLLVRS